MTVKTTPWEEARLRAILASQQALQKEGLWEDAIDSVFHTLSRLGYRIVPAEATHEMGDAAMAVGPPRYMSMISAATEAGDVLKEGR
ncbi:MAG: hypothetical protein ACOVVK_11705 [Elsteraceae bacterium]